jgi:hypothetical protein
MGIIKDFTEYENLHSLRESKSLKELSNHPRIKDLLIMEEIVNEGYFGDLLTGWKDDVLNAVTKKIPGAAMNRISKLIARYDKELFVPKIAEDIDLLKKRHLALYGDKALSDEQKKAKENDHQFQLTKDAWTKRLEANKKKWDAKENELRIEKKDLEEKYKGNPRITKAFALAIAKKEFERYKEAENKYKELLPAEEQADLSKDIAEKGKKVEQEKKAASAVAETPGKEGDGESPDVNDVKAGEVWQTKDEGDVTISMNLKDSIAAKKQKIEAGESDEYKKKGLIATTSDGKEIVIPVAELVMKKKDAEKTPTENIKELDDKINAKKEEIGKEKGADELKKLKGEFYDLKIKKAELEKAEGWEEEKSKLEDKKKRLETGEEDPEEKIASINKKINDLSDQVEGTSDETEKNKLKIETLKQRIELAKAKGEEPDPDFEKDIKKLEAGQTTKDYPDYKKGEKITYERRKKGHEGEKKEAIVVSSDPDRPEFLQVSKTGKGTGFEISKDQIINKKESK